MKSYKRITWVLCFVFCGFIACGGGEGTQPASDEDVSSGSASPLLDLLPEDNSITGWSRDGDPRIFGPGNLWEYINGAADGYLMYGFEEVVTADFTHGAEDSQALIDIYDMGGEVNAFGIYAQERNPDSEFTQIGVEGYVGGTALNFWAGSYYVKVTVFEESEDLKQEMIKLANAVSQKIGDPGSRPAQIGYFPTGNMVPNTVKYVPKDVLGQSFLENAFEAQYREDQNEYRLLLIELADSDVAKDCLSRYQNFISSSGEVAEDLTAPGDGGFTGKDSYYGNMIAVRAGSRLAVILGVPSIEGGKQTITELLQNIE
jgi:hypothetical protein